MTWTDSDYVVPGYDEYRREMKAEPLLAGMRTGQWLDEQEFNPLRWIVPGVLPEGASLMAGGPKVGKSWMAYGAALGVATGGVVLGNLAVEQRPVFMLALEDGDRRLQQRGRHLMRGNPLPENFYYMTRVQAGTVVEVVEAWLDKYGTGSPEPLVILDTLGKAMPPAEGNETTYLRDYRVAGELKTVTDDRPGMGLLVLHHDRKARSEDFVQTVSGTNGIAGAFDSILLVNRPRLSTTGTLRVTGRDVPEHEYALTVEDGRWRLEGESLAEAEGIAHEVKESARLGDRATEVLHYVNATDEVVTPKDVAEALGLDPKQVSVYLSRLVEAGRVVKKGRGSYQSVESVGSVDSLLMPAAVSTDTTLPTPPDHAEFDARPLVCEVCRSTEVVLRWGNPHWVVRCRAHNPMTWRP